MTTKVTKLTYDNVKALGEVYPAESVTLGATTAVFADEPATVARTLNELMARLPGRGHPKASLHAVLRKVLAKVEPLAHDDPRLVELRRNTGLEVS